MELPSRCLLSWLFAVLIVSPVDGFCLTPAVSNSLTKSASYGGRRSQVVSVLSRASTDDDEMSDERENDIEARDNALGERDPFKDFGGKEINVGDPQLVKEKERSVTSILKELAAIQQQGPQKYCILGTRHCSYLHQQIIELL